MALWRPRGSWAECWKEEAVDRSPDIVPATVSGIVFHSVSGSVLPGAEVRIAGRSVRTTSDLSGRFELPDMQPGIHRLTFSHP